MNTLNKTIAAIAVLTATMGAVQATSYTQSAGTSWGVSNSTGESHSVTYRQGSSITQSQDTAQGGLSGCSNCGAADNTITTKERVVVDTNLIITDTGYNQSSSASTSCFSGINVNGLNATEGRSEIVSSRIGVNFVSAEGTIDKMSRTKVTSTNGGAENGTKVDVVYDHTDLSESSLNTYSSGSRVITFTSSIGAE